MMRHSEEGRALRWSFIGEPNASSNLRRIAEAEVGSSAIQQGFFRTCLSVNHRHLPTKLVAHADAFNHVDSVARWGLAGTFGSNPGVFVPLRLRCSPTYSGGQSWFSRASIVATTSRRGWNEGQKLC